MVRKLWALAAVVAIVLACSSSAKADSIGPNCGTCQGSIYTLTYDPTPVLTTATTQVFQVTLTIDTTGYNGGGTFIDSVAVKVAPDVFATNSALVSAPGGVGQWNLIVGGINASGCALNPNNGFECAKDTVSGTGGAAPVPAGVYTWIFNIEINMGTLFTGLDEASVKARYVDDNGNKVGDLVSENITLQPIPEPGTMALFGTGLIGLAGAVRRRMSK